MDRDERIWRLKRLIKEGRFTAGTPGAHQWDRQDGLKRRHWTRSLIHEGGLQDPGLPQEHAFSIPVLRKRSNQERLESMIERLAKEDPTVQAKLLEEIAVGYWKEGAPVTMDALRKVSADIMNKADNRIRRAAGG